MAESVTEVNSNSTDSSAEPDSKQDMPPRTNEQGGAFASPVTTKALENEITNTLVTLWQFKDVLIQFKELCEKNSKKTFEESSKKFAEVSCTIEALQERIRLSDKPLDKMNHVRSIRTDLSKATEEIARIFEKEKLYLEIAGQTDPLINTYSDIIEKVTLLEANLATYFRMHKSDDELKQQAKSQSLIHGSSAIIRSQEIERQKIAREIHDGPAQAIANVIFRLDIIQKMIDQKPDSIPEEMAKVKEIAQGALNEIRHFIFDLRPMTLQDLGLIATLKKIVHNPGGKFNTKAELVIEGSERDLNPAVELAIFRIAQESLNNIRKHANANQAWIHLKYLEDKVVLIVEDNGTGFDVKKTKEKRNEEYNSFGLIGMQERADDIGGTLQVTSQSMRGTKIIFTVPVPRSIL